MKTESLEDLITAFGSVGERILDLTDSGGATIEELTLLKTQLDQAITQLANTETEDGKWARPSRYDNTNDPSMYMTEAQPYPQYFRIDDSVLIAGMDSSKVATIVEEVWIPWSEDVREQPASWAYTVRSLDEENPSGMYYESDLRLSSEEGI